MAVTTESLYEAFSRELAALHGRSYLVSSTIEVAHIISRVAAESGCTRIIKEGLLLEDEDLIRAELEKHGFRVVDLHDLSDPVAEMTKADLSITRADLLIASTGTLVILPPGPGTSCKLSA